MAHQQCWQSGLAEPHADPVAGDPRLTHLEQRPADLKPVTDANFVVGKSVHREVLAELAVFEVVPTQLIPPMVIRLELVDEHRSMRAAMASEVTLPVTVDVQSPDHVWSFDGILPDAGMHGPAAP